MEDGDSKDTIDRQGQLNVVESAEAAGVNHLVYISFLQRQPIACFIK